MEGWGDVEKNQEVLAHLIQSQTSMSQLAQVVTNLDSFSGKGDGGKKKKGEDGDEEVLKIFRISSSKYFGSSPQFFAKGQREQHIFWFTEKRSKRC